MANNNLQFLLWVLYLYVRGPGFKSQFSPCFFATFSISGLQDSERIFLRQLGLNKNWLTTVKVAQSCLNFGSKRSGSGSYNLKLVLKVTLLITIVSLVSVGAFSPAHRISASACEINSRP